MLTRSSTAAFVLALSMLLGVAGAHAQPSVMPEELEAVDVNEKLDKPLPADASFRDHTGKLVRLGDFFDGKRPVLLTLAYHTCKVVCSMVLGAEVEVLKNQPWTLGQEFRAVTISIDPRDTPQAANKKRQQMMALYGKRAPRTGISWSATRPTSTRSPRPSAFSTATTLVTISTRTPRC
jgi:protein SCO1